MNSSNFRLLSIQDLLEQNSSPGLGNLSQKDFRLVSQYIDWQTEYTTDCDIEDWYDNLKIFLLLVLEAEGL